MKWEPIPYDEKYKFLFLEDSAIKFMHPASNYYLKLDDLSVNILISLKWILWGHRFLSFLSNNLESLENHEMFQIIRESTQSIKNIKKEKHKLLIDDFVIKNINDLNQIIEIFYKYEIFDENTKIHMKLKINLNEYLVISNMLFPTLAKPIKLEKA